ncbi:hypothetical protein HMSSN036_30240 [Paenibacillus macerans]|nr:hypothetical protein HMSSN036_30240 [Paenibacillus macerans]
MIYKDASKSIHERVEDLIGRMTLKEKVAQLTCANSYGGQSVYDTRYEKLKDGIGTISYLNDSLTGDNKKDKETIRGIQKFLVEETRLGIPGLFHSEGIAGRNSWCNCVPAVSKSGCYLGAGFSSKDG